ncbi:unnamed protein product [Coregonus sp. 'balchen']|nr:unnamed protein product [Coregonus sp. 'balchen']
MERGGGERQPERDGEREEAGRKSEEERRETRELRGGEGGEDERTPRGGIEAERRRGGAVAIHCPAMPNVIAGAIHCPAMPYVIAGAIHCPAMPYVIAGAIHCPAMPYVIAGAIHCPAMPYVIAGAIHCPAMPYVIAGAIHCPAMPYVSRAIHCPAMPYVIAGAINVQPLLYVIAGGPSTVQPCRYVIAGAIHCPAMPYVIAGAIHCPAMPYVIAGAVHCPAMPYVIAGAIHCPAMPYVIAGAIHCPAMPYVIAGAIHCPAMPYVIAGAVPLSSHAVCNSRASTVPAMPYVIAGAIHCPAMPYVIAGAIHCPAMPFVVEHQTKSGIQAKRGRGEEAAVEPSSGQHLISPDDLHLRLASDLQRRALDFTNRRALDLGEEPWTQGLLRREESFGQKRTMSFDSVPAKSEVMGWNARSLADYMKRKMKDGDLQKFPTIHIPSKEPKNHQQDFVHEVDEAWDSEEFEMSDNDYENPDEDDSYISALSNRLPPPPPAEGEEEEGSDDDYEPPPSSATEEIPRLLNLTKPLGNSDYIDSVCGGPPIALPTGRTPRPHQRPGPQAPAPSHNTLARPPTSRLDPSPQRPFKAAGKPPTGPSVPLFDRSKKPGQPAPTKKQPPHYHANTKTTPTREGSPFRSPQPAIVKPPQLEAPTPPDYRSSSSKPAPPSLPAPPSHPPPSMVHNTKPGTEEDMVPVWYGGLVTRGQAEASLRWVNKDGAFLVRDSSKGSSEQPYTLMVLNQGKVYNVQIRHQGNTYHLGTGLMGIESFPGVKEMIDHYTHTPLLLIDMEIGTGAQSHLKSCLAGSPRSTLFREAILSGWLKSHEQVTLCQLGPHCEPHSDPQEQPITGQQGTAVVATEAINLLTQGMHPPFKVVPAVGLLPPSRTGSRWALPAGSHKLSQANKATEQGSDALGKLMS